MDSKKTFEIIQKKALVVGGFVLFILAAYLADMMLPVSAASPVQPPAPVQSAPPIEAQTVSVEKAAPALAVTPGVQVIELRSGDGFTMQTIESIIAFAQEQEAMKENVYHLPSWLFEPVTFDPAFIGYGGKDNIPSWKAQNSDIKGWLRIPGTNIDYPVIQYKDNDYYLSRGYHKEDTEDGVIYVDYVASLGDRTKLSKNTVIYGHNWTNYTTSPRVGYPGDRMLAQLPSYHYLGFAQKYPYLYFSTEQEDMLWQIFAVFYTEIGFDYIQTNPDAAGFSSIVKEAKSRSIHNFPVEVDPTDKIITISTCTRMFGDYKDQRLVVMAKLLPKERYPYALNITANPSYKRPTLTK